MVKIGGMFMKEKKTIIILILVLAVGIVGLTIAYFSNSSTVNNVFTTQPYGTTVTETFTSPSNWLPGSEVEKLVIATNTGNVDEAVRISLSENWTTAHNNTLNGWITENGNKSSHLPENEPSNDERVAIINFDNNEDWEYSNGYYYYKYKLSPNESTSSLIKSVTFNAKTKLDDTCVETPTATGRTITCDSSGDDYDNATYTLTFNIETVQYNKYKEAWNTNYNIAESKPVATVCSYEIGDEITYDDETYYVIRNSDSTVDYVVALKDTPLTAQQVNTYGDESVYVSQDGEYPYYTSETCSTDYYNNWDYSLHDGEFYGCLSNYNQSNVKNIVDRWASQNESDLIDIGEYKARLISQDDIINLGYIFYMYTGNLKKEGEKLYDWLFVNDYEYWTMTSVYDNYEFVYSINDDATYDYVFNKLKIRPVINLKKSAIESACPTH